MSKEKQIEEMAETLCEDCAKDSPCSLAAVGGMCNSVRKQATAIYNAGYRKQTEVAREIFAEIGKILKHYSDREDITGDTEAVIWDIGFAIAELKKKYTEEQT